MADAEYKQKLDDFVLAAELEYHDIAVGLFEELKHGTPEQLAQAGYAIMTGKNMNKPGYEPFPYMREEQGLPVFPAAPKRAGWGTFVRIDRNAFPKDAKLLFTADINVCPGMLNKLSLAGEAEYSSPAFGWLGEKK